MQTRYVALLRAINVTGRNMVAMSELKQLFADLGFPDAKTLLQSGNVVFSADSKSAAALEKKLEAELTKRLGLTIDFLVRSSDEWAEIIAGNPFAKEAKNDPAHLVLTCLKSEPKPAALTALAAAIKGKERFHADGRQLYIVYPDGIGPSKFTSNLVEKHLATRGTARNWNTVVKLQALLQSPL